VFHNDIVVVATDGVFDNIFVEDIITCIESQVLDSSGDLEDP